MHVHTSIATTAITTTIAYMCVCAYIQVHSNTVLSVQIKPSSLLRSVCLPFSHVICSICDHIWGL